MKAITTNEMRTVDGGVSCVCTGCYRSWSGPKWWAYAQYCNHRFVRKVYGKKNPCYFKTPYYYYE